MFWWGRGGVGWERVTRNLYEKNDLYGAETKILVQDYSLVTQPIVWVILTNIFRMKVIFKFGK